jgi:hypothetical protein
MRSAIGGQLAELADGAGPVELPDRRQGIGQRRVQHWPLGAIIQHQTIVPSEDQVCDVHPVFVRLGFAMDAVDVGQFPSDALFSVRIPQDGGSTSGLCLTVSTFVEVDSSHPLPGFVRFPGNRFAGPV